MPIDFPKSPSTNDTYTYLSATWMWNGTAWEKSAATETGNIEGSTAGVAYYHEKGSNIKGATAFHYDDTNLRVSIGGTGPTETLDVRGGITASGNIFTTQGITSDTLQVASGATFGGTVHFDEDTRFHGNIVMNEDGQIKVDGDGETIKLNFSGGILDISANNVDIAKKLRHRGDPDTYLEYTTDTVKFYAGGTNNIILTAQETNFSDTQVTRPKLKDYTETFHDVGDINASTAFDFEDGNVQKCKVTGTDTGSQIVFSFTNPPADGIAGTMTVIFENGLAHGDIAFASGDGTSLAEQLVKWPGNNAPTLSSSGFDIITFMTHDAGFNVYGFVGGLNFS